MYFEFYFVDLKQIKIFKKKYTQMSSSQFFPFDGFIFPYLLDEKKGFCYEIELASLLNLKNEIKFISRSA